MISRLEAAVGGAGFVVSVCLVADWETGMWLAGVPFLGLVAVFTARTIYRKGQGQTWNEAAGRRPADRL